MATMNELERKIFVEEYLTTIVESIPTNGSTAPIKAAGVLSLANQLNFSFQKHLDNGVETWTAVTYTAVGQIFEEVTEASIQKVVERISVQLASKGLFLPAAIVFFGGTVANLVFSNILGDAVANGYALANDAAHNDVTVYYDADSNKKFDITNGFDLSKSGTNTFSTSFLDFFGNNNEDFTREFAAAAQSEARLEFENGDAYNILPVSIMQSLTDYTNSSNSTNLTLTDFYNLPNNIDYSLQTEGNYFFALDTDTVTIPTSEGSVTVPVSKYNIKIGTSGADNINVPPTVGDLDSFILGYGGTDILEGDSGNDFIDGGADNDTIYGKDGNDTILGGSGRDRLYGEGFIEGNQGTNSTYNDLLIGGDDIDSLYGRVGNDTLEGSDGGYVNGVFFGDYIYGNGGNDFASYKSSNAAVTVNLGNAVGSQASGGHAEGDELYSIEGIIGSSYNDTLTGDGGINTILGGAGNDTIEGGAGADILDGGSNDIYGDLLSYAGSAQGVTVGLFDNSTGVGGDAEGDTIINFERIIGSSFNDNLTGNTENNTIRGGDGNDSLFGSDGNDNIYGGNDNDTLSGGLGVDILDGGNGNNYVSYLYTNQNITVNLSTQVGNVGTNDIDGFVNIENVLTGDGNDKIIGSTQNNTLISGSGNDTIIASGGNDIIDGGADTDLIDYSQLGGSTFVNVDLGVGNTYLNGATTGSPKDTFVNIENVLGTVNNDNITGDSGNNTLAGGFGADVLTGGLGDDTFVMEHQAGVTDVITDYGTGANELKFVGSGFGTIDPAYFDYDPANPDANPNVTVDDGDTTIHFANGYHIKLLNYGADGLAATDPTTDPTADPTNPTLPPDGTTAGGINYSYGGATSVDYLTALAFIPDAASIGDPHLLTFDGLRYNFQSTGEFTLVESTDANDFTIQTRQGKWGSHASINTAVATLVGTTKIGFYIDGSLPYDSAQLLLNDPSYNGEVPNFYVGDEAFIIPDGNVMLIDGGGILRNGDSYTVFNDNGDGFIVDINQHSSGRNYIDVVPFLSDSRAANSVQGLLGNDDNDVTNEFILQSSTDVSGGITANTLYNVFGDDWRITQGESLFLYKTGEDTTSFGSPNPSAYITLADFPQVDIDAATAAAIAAGFDPNSEIFNDVVMDFIVMGDVEFTTLLQDLEIATTGTVEATVTNTANVNIGTDAAEIIYGTVDVDVIYARAGNDTVYASSSDDTIIGGLGDDLLMGEGGVDTFIHNVGDGNDELHSYTLNYLRSNSLAVVEMNGVAANDLFMNVSGYDIIVTDAATGETLTLKNQISYTNYGFEFDTVNGIDVKSGLTIKGTSATLGENLFGTAFGDTFIGGVGDDTISGNGGVGDTFIHNVGDGNDIIYSIAVASYRNNAQAIVQMNGVATNDLFMNVSGFDIIVTDAATGETLTLKNQISYTNYGFEFASVNGIAVNSGLTIKGSSATLAENLYGSAYGDTFIGGVGDDTISGNGGVGDTFIHNVGDGNDIIYSIAVASYRNNAQAVVQMNGVAANDLYMSVSGYDIIVTDIATGETLTLTNQISYTNYGFEFASVNGIAVNSGLVLKGTSATASETIYGSSYGDTMIGGVGDDTLAGNGGVDTFVHNVGDGNDELHGSALNYLRSNSLSVVQMNGVTADNIFMNVSGYDIIVTDAATGEALTLKSQISYTNYGFEFDTVNGIDVKSGLTIKGSSASLGEVLYGTGYGDTIIGGAGADTINSYGGNDFIKYDALTDSTIAARDAIVDFAIGYDKIDVSGINTIDDITDITISNSGGFTYIDDNLSDFSIELTGTHALTANDFVFI